MNDKLSHCFLFLTFPCFRWKDFMVILIETEAYVSDFAGDPTANKFMLSFNPTTIALMEDRVRP